MSLDRKESKSQKYLETQTGESLWDIEDEDTLPTDVKELQQLIHDMEREKGKEIEELKSNLDSLWKSLDKSQAEVFKLQEENRQILQKNDENK